MIRMTTIMVIAMVIVGNLGVNVHAKEYELDEGKRLEFSISGREQNRIKIKGDRIAEVIGLNEEYQVETENRQGQIFLKAKEDAGEISFTIVTEGGKTQDIKVKPKPNISGQIIIFKEEDKPNSKIMGAKHSRHEDMANILKAYSSKKVKSEKVWQDIGGDLGSRQVLSEIHGGYFIEIWEIKNKSSNKTVKLDEKLFRDESEIAAIMLENLELDPKDVTKLYKVRNYGG